MGDSKGPVKQEPETQAQAAPAQISAQMQNHAAFSPGQQGLLAQQMQQGFGGSLLDQINAMDFYRDMQAPVVNSPADLLPRQSAQGAASAPAQAQAQAGMPLNFQGQPDTRDFFRR